MATHTTPTISGSNVFNQNRGTAGGPTDTTYRTFLGYIDDMLTANGLTRTADTGQYDSATVTISTTRVYSVWAFNDDAHATNPLFLRISFQTNAVPPGGRLSMYWEAGRGSNGSGTLTNIVAAEQSPNGLTIDPFIRCCLTDDGFLALEMGDANASPASGRGIFLVSRMGYEPGDIMHIYSTENAGISPKRPTDFKPVTTQTDWTDANALNDNAMGDLFVFPWGVMASEPGYTSVFPAIVARSAVSGAAADYVIPGFCAFKRGEYPAGSPFTVNLDGVATRTYMPSAIKFNTALYGLGATAAIAYVWE